MKGDEVTFVSPQNKKSQQSEYFEVTEDVCVMDEGTVWSSNTKHTMVQNIHL